jgi:outer membrane protein OmpA-like peptidoglycan-associated protein
MNKQSRFLNSAVFASALALAACSTVPTSTPTLDQARADFVAASNSPRVSQYAPLEFKQATDALDMANAAAAHHDSLEKVDQLAYVAKQKIATAREVARTKAAEAEVAHARQERTEVQLEARTAEAERARADAAVANAQAASAQQQADAERQRADQAQQQAQQAQQQTAMLADHAARLEALLVELHAVKTARGYVVTIGDVLFDTDKASLKPEGLSTLRKLADAMGQNPDRTVLVEGFTDSTGTASHNQELSERRASTVATTLAGMGVPRERVAMRAYGEAFPVASNDNAANRQRNRRVEIVLSNDGTAIPPRAAMR